MVYKHTTPELFESFEVIASHVYDPYSDILNRFTENKFRNM